jgi:hypothetical protein
MWNVKNIGIYRCWRHRTHQYTVHRTWSFWIENADIRRWYTCNYTRCGRTVALGSTQTQTEMSTRNISWGPKAVSTTGWQPYNLHVPNVYKIWKPQTPGALRNHLGLCRGSCICKLDSMILFIYLYWLSLMAIYRWNVWVTSCLCVIYNFIVCVCVCWCM